MTAALTDRERGVLAWIAAAGPEGRERIGSAHAIRVAQQLEDAGLIDVEARRYKVTSAGLDALDPRRAPIGDVRRG